MPSLQEKLLVDNEDYFFSDPDVITSPCGAKLCSKNTREPRLDVVEMCLK